MKKILFTGGSGFLGSAVCNQLHKNGHLVVAFDNFSRKSHLQSLDKGIATFSGDVRNIQDLNDAIEKYGPFDDLWHFAYINGTSTFYSHPELVLDVGVKGAINTLDIALKNGIRNYVLASTSEVYNEPTQVPTSENERMIISDVSNPRFSYSGGKIISELLAIHYGAKQGLNTKIFRPHNIFGPNMGTEHVIPEIIKKILLPENPKYIDGKLVISIQGNGTETRAFCYIDEAVKQIILAADTDCSEKSPTYNVGIEQETSISELVYLIADILDIRVLIESGEKTGGSSNRRCPSMKKMKELGYDPIKTLQEGLKTTIEWYKEFYTRKV